MAALHPLTKATLNTITIAMAAFKEFESCYFTLTALRTYHGRNFNILLLDNAPKGCKRTEQTVAAVGGKYLHRPDLSGTSRPRDALFQFSETPFTCIIDSHVLLQPGAVEAMIKYAVDHPSSVDIISGPLVGDNAIWTATEWDQPHPPGLWGGWSVNPEYALRWGANGDKESVDQMEPFEINSMGLGLYMMRSAVWPGFNKHFRGFGGEEGYVHTKVRQLGGRALCHPSLRWTHLFRDVAGWSENSIPYPATERDHVRNMVIGHRELGINPIIIREKFGKKPDQATWDSVVAEAEKIQEFGKLQTKPKTRMLGIWYTANTPPASLLEKSLQSISTAADQSRHPVTLSASVHVPIISDVKQTIFKGEKGKGHKTIVAQMRDAIAAAPGEYDAICFLENDVFYPPGYFDRIGDAFADNSDAPVVSHADYIGLNSTGWLAVKELHSPLHQLSMRWDVAMENLKRAEAECEVQGWAYLEPDSANEIYPQFAEIEKGIWIGEQPDSPPHGVTAILNLTQGQDDYSLSPQFECVHSFISDNQRDPAPSLKWLEQQVEWVTKKRAENKSVYIHCRGGVSRSGMVTVAYLMSKYKVKKEEALRYIRKVRPQVAPRQAFWTLLAEYEKTLGVDPTATIKDSNNRDKWVTIKPEGFTPSVHVNHEQGRLTSHGEVVFETKSSLGTNHPFWGEASAYWPGLMQPTKDKSGCGSCNKNQPQSVAPPIMVYTTRDELIADVIIKSSDFNEHVVSLRELADKCDVVAEVSLWDDKPALYALADSKATKVYSFCPRKKKIWPQVERFWPGKLQRLIEIPEKLPEQVDLLFIDMSHTAESIIAQFTAYSKQVNHYLACHTSMTFGETGDNGGPGVLAGIRTFLRDNPEWTVLRHDKNNHGFLVLTKKDEDKQRPPGLIKKALNFSRATAKHLANGAQIVDDTEWNERLDHCMLCEHRWLDTCGKCGCNLELKTSWKTSECPDDPPRWKKSLLMTT